MSETEKLFRNMKRWDWEYAVARHVDLGKYKVITNMNEKLGDTFEAFVLSKNIRDKYVIRYTCPVEKKLNENGKIMEMKLDYKNQKWDLITRKEYNDAKGR